MRPWRVLEHLPWARLDRDALDEPQLWGRATRMVRIFGDLFRENVPDQWIAEILAIAEDATDVSFFVASENLARMRRSCNAWSMNGVEPAPNIVIGTIVRSIADAEQRLPALCETPAARRWVEVVGDVDVTPWVGCPYCLPGVVRLVTPCAICRGTGRGIHWELRGTQLSETALRRAA